MEAYSRHAGEAGPKPLRVEMGVMRGKRNMQGNWGDFCEEG